MQPHGEWEFLPHFVLRSTGFPFEWLERLRFTETVQQCRATIDLEEHLVSRRNAILEQLRDGTPGLVNRSLLLKVKRTLQEFLPLPPGTVPLTEQIQELQRWDDLVAQRTATLDQVRTSFPAELVAQRRTLFDLAHTEPFREAVFLSSPNMHQQTLRGYLERFDPLVRNADARRDERKVFSYLQRFCGKNETASFFGPINYGTIDPTSPDNLLYERSGPGTVRAKETFFCFWGTGALAERISRDPDVLPYVPPRLNPLCRVEEDAVVIQVVQKHLPLKPAIRRLLLTVDGKQTVYDLACSMASTCEELLPLLTSLTRIGVLIHRLEVPTSVFHPLSYLIAQVEQLPENCAGKGRWLEALAKIDAYRERFAMAPFADRPAILAELETFFGSLTGSESRRGDGRIYADRTLLYEECHGTIKQFQFGGAFYERFRHQLAAALELSAVYGRHQWDHWQRVVLEAFQKLSPEGAPVPYADFLTYLQEHKDEWPPEPPCPWVEDLKGKLEQWRAEHPDERTFQILLADLPVQAQPAPRYSLPDICVAAESVDAIAKGDCQIILSKLHHHMLVWGWLLYFHDDRPHLDAALKRYMADFEQYRQMLHLAVVRRNKGFYSYPGRSIEYLSPSGQTAESAYPMSDVFVARDRDELVLRRGATEEPLLLYLSLADQVGYAPFHAFALPSLSQIPLLLPGHTPRVVIDDVVYQRESWLLPADDCSDLIAQQGMELMLAAERFRRKHGMPQWVYVRTSLERKPYAVDFANYFALELIQSIIRRGGTLLVQEMLPAPDQLWLRDENGRYSTELRMNCFKVAAAWQPPAAGPRPDRQG